MNGANWYNQNSNRSYPFIQNTNTSKLLNSEILDCRFYITNPETNNLKVFLKSKTIDNTTTKYTFCNKANPNKEQTVVFSVPKESGWKCIWNTDNSDFYGFIVVEN